jgi:hypothetical protein
MEKILTDPSVVVPETMRHKADPAVFNPDGTLNAKNLALVLRQIKKVYVVDVNIDKAAKPIILKSMTKRFISLQDIQSILHFLIQILTPLPLVHQTKDGTTVLIIPFTALYRYEDPSAYGAINTTGFRPDAAPYTLAYNIIAGLINALANPNTETGCLRPGNKDPISNSVLQEFLFATATLPIYDLQMTGNPYDAFERNKQILQKIFSLQCGGH